MTTPSIIFATPYSRLADGWCIASRAYARAMHEAGVHLNMLETLPEETQQLDPEVREEMKAIIDEPFDPVLDYYLYSGVLMGHKRMKAIIASFMRQPVTVGYHCFFERLNLEQELVEALKGVSVCTTSKGNLKTLKGHGLTDVTRFPYPWFSNDSLRDIPATSNASRFYWIGRFEPRKAPDRLIRAFMRAFEPGEAFLTMKLSSYIYPGYEQSPEGVVLSELVNTTARVNGWRPGNWDKGISFIRDKLTRREMVKLHAENDIYVSPSLGEGLELGAWDAKQAGRRLITTASGGPEDVACDSDILIPTDLTRLAHMCYNDLWGPDAEYADYHAQDLITALKNVRYGTSIYGERFSSGEHTSLHVGELIKQWLKDRIP